MFERSSLKNQMLPTMGRREEMLPISTRIRKMRETRKQKDVNRAKSRRVRVADFRVDLEREVEVRVLGRRDETKLGRAMRVGQRWMKGEDDYLILSCPAGAASFASSSNGDAGRRKASEAMRGRKEFNMRDTHDAGRFSNILS